MAYRHHLVFGCGALVAFFFVGCSAAPVSPEDTVANVDQAIATSTLHVSGKTLVDNGSTVRLLGADRSGTEFQCLHNGGIFDGPVNQAAVTTMASWHMNAIRVPLNEDCWLAINGSPSAFSGANYRSAISKYVTLLRSNDFYVILDLHWNGPGSVQSKGQLPMADASHAPSFWSSVASTFKGDLGVVFDLYNEPHDISWACWKSGCTVPANTPGNTAGAYTAAGMQQLVSAVRATGARNVILAGGLAFANDLSEWLANKPNDPTGNLAASLHNYNFNACSNVNCWNAQVKPVAHMVPVVTGEMGENDCAAKFIDTYMQWADTVGISYLGWAWNADFSCAKGPSLISNFNGTATALGAGLKSHLAAANP